MDTFALLFVFLIVPLGIGIYCLKKFSYYKKKEPNGLKWKIYLILGSILTFIIPGIIAFILVSSLFWVTCYLPMLPNSVSSVLLVSRKELLEKYRKKIGNKIYGKIKTAS